MTEDPRATQMSYYRARAGEYDADAYGSPETNALIALVTGQVPEGGDLLELACGTGVWTQRLVHRASTVTAVDAAPEMIDIARGRAPGATFLVADLFDWRPPRRFDTIFFGFWLSHVPPQCFDAFWRGIATALAAGGRVIFVDEDVSKSDQEIWLSDDLVLRQLSDGSTYRVVKTRLDPERLRDRLAVLGWRANVQVLPGGRWLLGQASREARVAG